MIEKNQENPGVSWDQPTIVTPAFDLILFDKMAAVNPGQLLLRCQYLFENASREVVTYHKLTPQMAFDKCDKLKLDLCNSNCLYGRH